MTILETERLRLRTMVYNDVDNLLRIFADPIAMQHYPRTRGRDEVMSWVERTQGKNRDYGVGMWVVESRDSGEFYGQCGIIPQLVHDDTIEWEIGYALIRQFWHRGFAIEAALACRDLGFSQRHASHLISIISPSNLPSIQVAMKNGMTRRELTLWRGHQIAVYQITQDQWAGQL
ncbi:MAG: GNAT family N-acetyltransferase [Firmicutes bacterium]|nr:GNAT family N-acetyltransferase [Bacillota bacterium]